MDTRKSKIEDRMRECIGCGKQTGKTDGYINYCNDCHKVYKRHKKRETISNILWATVLIVLAIALIIYFRSGGQLKIQVKGN